MRGRCGAEQLHLRGEEQSWGRAWPGRAPGVTRGDRTARVWGQREVREWNQGRIVLQRMGCGGEGGSG